MTSNLRVRVTVFLGAVLKTGALVWLWAQRLPHYGADAIQLRQPAIELLRSGRFLLPTVWGTIPHSETFFAAYPPGYSLLTAAAMHAGARSLAGFLAQDLLIHAATSLALASWVFATTKRAWPFLAFLITSFAVLLPLGRPEEFASLLFVGCLALAASKSSRVRVLAFVPLGVAGATGPLTAVITSVFFTLFALRRDGVSLPIVIRIGLQLGAAAVLATLVWGSLVVGHTDAFFEQFAEFRKLSYLPSPLEVVAGAPGLALLVIVGTATTWFLVPATSQQEDLTPTGRALLFAARYTLPVGIGFNLLARRPHYDYRLIAILATATALVAVSRWATEAPRGHVWAIIFVFVTGSAAVVQCVSLLRFALSPFGEPGVAARYDDVVEQARRLIPPEASVGGDGAFLELNERQPLYADLNITDERRWPDYLVSTTWADPPYVLGKERWRKIVEQGYEEVVTAGHPYTPGCALHLAGARLPLARGTCGWNLRVWRRIGLAQQ